MPPALNPPHVCAVAARLWIWRLAFAFVLLAGLLLSTRQAQAQIAAGGIVSTSVAKPSTSTTGGGNFWIDSGASLMCNYLSYKITNGATPQADIWVKWRVTSGTILSLGGGDTGIAHPGAFAAGETKAVFFYVCASATSNVYQEHVLDIYNNDPAFGTLLTTSGTMGFRTFGGNNSVPDTIQAASNKVTAVLSGPNPPGIGGILTMTVTGNTGNLGAPGYLSMTPATQTIWNAGALQLVTSTVTFGGPNNVGTFTDRLELTGADFGGSFDSSENTPYTMAYSLKIVNTTTTSIPVTPVGYFSSGGNLKHTNIDAAYGNLLPLQPLTNFLTLVKLADISVTSSGGGVVNYVLRVTNTGGQDATLDQFVDILPGTPANATYISGSSLFNGVAVSNPNISGQTLTWSGTFLVPPGATRDFKFFARLPGTAGTYINSGYAKVLSTQIDTTSITSDNAPGTAAVVVLAAPVIVKTFTPNAAAVNGAVTLSFTVTNPNTAYALSGVAFSDTFPVAPGQMVVAGPVNASTANCGTPIFNPVAAANGISFANGSIAAGGTCTVSLSVQANTLGTYTNTTSTVTDSYGSVGAAAVRTFTVTAQPSIVKSFTASTIASGGTAVLAFDITSNFSGTTSNISFTDTFPATMTVASPVTTTNTCGATFAPAVNAASLTISGGTLTGLGSTCRISVVVSATVTGNNTTGVVTSTGPGGTGTTSNTATLTVASPPSITKAFLPATTGVNQASRLTFIITNPNASIALTGVGFADTFPVNMFVFSTPNAATTNCGTPTFAPVAGAGSITFSGGTIAAAGTCTVALDVRASATGTFANTSAAVTSTNGGTGAVSNTASLVVNTLPSVVKSFSVATIGADTASPTSGTPSPASATFAVLTLVITNTRASAIAGVSVTDTFPSGMYVAAPLTTSTSGCSNASVPTLTSDTGAALTTLTFSTSASTGIRLNNASIAAGGTCTVTVRVTARLAGAYNNTTSGVATTTATAGTGAVSNTATLTIVSPPGLAKSFSPGTVGSGGPSTVILTLTNPNTGTVLNNVSVTDTFPLLNSLGAGGAMKLLTVTTLTNSCGGTVTSNTGGALAADAAGVRITGVTLAAGTSCALTFQVYDNSTGDYNNQTSSVTANEGTGNIAAAILTVNSSPSITKAFSPTAAASGAAVTATFQIRNGNSGASITNVRFTDNLPAGMTVASPPAAATSACGTPVFAPTAGAASLSFSGGTIAAAGTCTVTVNVTATVAGDYVNITSTVVASSGAATVASVASNQAIVNIVAPPTLTKSFVAASIVVGQTVTMRITVSSPLGNTRAITGIAFTDNLPSGMMVASPPAVTNTCGGTLAGSGSGSTGISLSGVTLASGGQSCYIELNVTTLTTGPVINTAGPPSTTNAGTGAAATAGLNVTAVALTGVVYRDANQNGSQGSGEDWSTGVTVNVNLVQGGVVQYSIAVNPGTGAFSFPTLPNGTYTAIVTDSSISITPTAPSGWVFVNPSNGGQIVAIASTSPSFPVYFGLFGSNAVRISGRVFLDNGNVGSNANNGVLDASETAQVANVTMLLSNCAGTVYATAVTDSGGAYAFAVAPAAAPQNFCVTKVNPLNYLSTGASVGAVTVAQGGTVVTAPGTTTYRYCREIAAGLCGTLTDTVAFASSAGNMLYPNLNFGVVRLNQLTADQARFGEPGNFVDFPHTLLAQSYGLVSFTVTPVQTGPVDAIFTELIYRDANCNGVLDAGESLVAVASVSIAAFPALPAAVCVIVRQQVAPSVPYGAERVFRLNAHFDYFNINPSKPADSTLVFNTDSTRIGITGALRLVKTVRNCGVSGASCPATFTASNSGVPNDVLEYQITFTNMGQQSLSQITINDFTSPYTTFVSAAASTPLPATLSACSKSTPAGTTACATAQAAGGTGAISWTFTGPLNAGLGGAVQFRVKVDP